MTELAIRPCTVKYRFDRAFQDLRENLQDFQDISQVFDMERCGLLRSMRSSIGNGDRLGFLLHESANALAQIGAENDARELWALAREKTHATRDQQGRCVERAHDLMNQASHALQHWLLELSSGRRQALVSPA